MANDTAPVDIMYIVPTNKYDTYCRAIHLATWVLGSDKTFDLMSADEFVRIHRGMSGAEIYASIKKLCISIVNARDISRREWKEFAPLWDSWREYFDQVHSPKAKEANGESA